MRVIVCRYNISLSQYCSCSNCSIGSCHSSGTNGSNSSRDSIATRVTTRVATWTTCGLVSNRGRFSNTHSNFKRYLMNCFCCCAGCAVHAWCGARRSCGGAGRGACACTWCSDTSCCTWCSHSSCCTWCSDSSCCTRRCTRRGASVATT